MESLISRADPFPNVISTPPLERASRAESVPDAAIKTNQLKYERLNCFQAALEN